MPVKFSFFAGAWIWRLWGADSL